jgi:hypothetical protein
VAVRIGMIPAPLLALLWFGQIESIGVIVCCAQADS